MITGKKKEIIHTHLEFIFLLQKVWKEAISKNFVVQVIL